MEINITEFFKSADPADYSASCAELGADAGAITWQAAIDSGYTFLTTETEKQKTRDYLETFGAWDKAEIDSWNDTELNAMVVQLISADFRESILVDNPDNWAEYYNDEQNSGRLSKGDDNQIYYYIGE